MTEDESLKAQAEQESLRETVKRDLSNASKPQLLGVVAVLGWMAFQWGWGNDILLPPIAARAFDAVDDGESWTSAVGAVVAGTGVGSLFWALTQTLDGVIVLTGLRLVPAITARISRFVGRQGWIKPYRELSFGTRFLIAYASGASVLCLVDVFATGKPGLRSRLPMLGHAVVLAVSGVAIAIFVVATATAVGRRVPATRGAADVVLGFARNPLTWLVIYGSLVGGSALIERLRSE